MLLILFGTKDRRKVVTGGQFICPKCGVKRDYEVLSLREWFTHFFIPIVPTGNNEGREQFVGCGVCKIKYDSDALKAR